VKIVKCLEIFVLRLYDFPTEKTASSLSRAFWDHDENIADSLTLSIPGAQL